MSPKLPEQTYLEISLNCRRHARQIPREAKDFLTGLGIVSNRLVVSETKTGSKLSFYTRSLNETKKVTKAFSRLPIKGVRLNIKSLGRRDWLDKWKLYYRSTPIGKRLMIVPLWKKGKVRLGGREPLYLEPGGAFGSGLHETTRLIVALMEKLSGRFGTFLDIGTGTGILAVTAAKLGARQVFGIDRDKQSVSVARANFKINGCLKGGFSRGDLKTVRFGQRYDLVAANLISKTLIQYRKKIQGAVCPRGYLLVSGIHRINLSGFLKAFSHPHFFCPVILNGRSWSALLYRRH